MFESFVKPAGQELYGRYGSPGRIAKTIYEDPFGVAADVAGIASGGEGLALRAGPRLARVAEAAGAVSKIDPLVGAIKLGSKAADVAASKVIHGTLRPSPKTAANFDVTPGELVERVKKSGVTDETQAAEAAIKLGERDTALAKEMTAQGHPGGSWEEFTKALDEGGPRLEAEIQRRQGDPKAAAQLNKIINDLKTQHQLSEPTSGRGPTVSEPPTSEAAVANAMRAYRELGGQAQNIPTGAFGDLSPAARARVEQLGPQAQFVPPRMLANPQGVRLGAEPARPGEWAKLPLDEMLEGKRSAQRKAYQADKGNKGFKALLNRTKAQNLKGQIDTVAPELSAASKETQEMMSVEHAFKDAASRPGRAGGLMNAVVMTALGHPVAGILGQGALSLAESARAGAKLGQQMHRGAQLAMSPRLLRLAQSMRAAGARQDEIDAALMREMVAEGR
jgi:hypothetical protein